jgi:serpin B
VLEVNEEGSEAAAATAVVMMLTCAMPMPPESFIADHPFMVFIVDNRAEAILFMGRLINPPASSAKQEL